MGWSFGASRMWVQGAAAAVLAGCLATAGAAHAETVESTSGFDVMVTGRIVSDCVLTGGADFDLGELTGGEVVKANLGLRCNLPFDLTFESQRGGLAHIAKPRGEGPFAGLLPYTLRVVVPTLAPQAGTMSASYSSADLIARRTLSSGEAVAAGGGEIEFRMQQPQGAGLLAGEYSETLNVTLQPRV